MKLKRLLIAVYAAKEVRQAMNYNDQQVVVVGHCLEYGHPPCHIFARLEQLAQAEGTLYIHRESQVNMYQVSRTVEIRAYPANSLSDTSSYLISDRITPQMLEMIPLMSGQEAQLGWIPIICPSLTALAH